MRKKLLLIVSTIFLVFSSYANDAKYLDLLPPQSIKNRSVKVEEPSHWYTSLNVRNGMMANQDVSMVDEINKISEIFGWTAGIMALSLDKKEKILMEEHKSSTDLLFESGQLRKERMLREVVSSQFPNWNK